MPSISNFTDSTTAPARKWITVTDGVDTDLSDLAVKAIFINGGGTVVAEDEDGTVATWTVPASFTLDIQPTRIFASSTATDIIVYLVA